MGHMSAAERAAKTQLGVDTSRNLNLYTADLPNGLLGWATFPADLKGDHVRDGTTLIP